MATQALYNRWRGQVFADILGQDHITKTLQNQIRAGRVGHAYLFTGMRGTGKTSTARIMAKAVNCVGETDEPPCDRCHICRSIAEGRSLDLIEIDGASNRGIDEVRQLRDGVSFAPSEGRYKIYVIDEVHMLTNEAFNALLKTLEEPPPHVIFILCTTAPHRLPDTVLSRCQRFDFRRASVSLLLKKLRMICEQENIAIQPDALEFVARRATGSFRDAESLLDQLASYSNGVEEITLEQVQSILGTVSSALVTDLVLSMTRADLPAGLRTINEAIDNGAEPRQFLREIIDHLRALLLLKVGGKDEQHSLSDPALAKISSAAESQSLSVSSLVRAIKLFNEAVSGLRYAVRPQVPLELAFVEAAIESGPVSPRTETPVALPTKQPPSEASRPQEVIPRPRAEEPGLPATEQSAPVAVGPAVSGEGAPASAPAPAGAPVSGPGEERLHHAPETPPTGDAGSIASIGGAKRGAASVGARAGDATEAPGRKPTLKEIRGCWGKVLAQLRPVSRRVEAVLRDTRPAGVRGDLITIECASPFHHDVLSDDKTRELVGQALSQVLEIPCRVRYVLRSGEATTIDDRSRKSPSPGGSLATAGARQEARQKLLNHPAVKELERRGGRVSKVTPAAVDEQEDRSG